MEDFKGINVRPIIYLVSPTSLLKEYMEEAVREMHVVLQVSETIERFLSTYDELSPGCIVLSVMRYDRVSADFLARVLMRNKNAQVILSACNWNVKDIVHAIQHGFVDFFDITLDSTRTRATLSMAIERDRRCREDRRFEIPQSVLDALNSEEIEIFQLMIQGRTNKELGAELDLSVRTVHYRKATIFSKLGVRSRNEAFEIVRKIRHDNDRKLPHPHFPEVHQLCSVESTESHL